MRQIVPLALLLLATSCATYVPPPPSAPHPFIVFFPEKSAKLEPAAIGIIARAAEAARSTPNQPVLVRGYTDSRGQAQPDLLLSRQRAQQVADQLQADGVPQSHIIQQGRGQTHNDPGLESRRVEIRIGS